MPGFRSRLIRFLFGFCCLHQWATAQTKADILHRKYPPEQLRADLVVFRDVVLKMHPAVGLYRNKTFFEKLFQEKIDGLKDSLSEKNFRIYCKLIVEELHCGHTEAMGSKAYNKAIAKSKLNYSPYVFLPVADRLFVIANLNKKQDSLIPKGVEIKTLNGIASDSILRYCRRFISTDGFNPSLKYHYVQLGFNNLYPSLFGRPDSFSVEYKSGAVISEHHYAAFQVKQLPPVPLKKANDSLLLGSKKSGIRYREIDDKKIFLLKLDRFAHNRYKRIYRKTFRRLSKQPETNLVLDLRNNGGGSLAHAYKLLSYLQDTVRTQTLYTRIKRYPEKKYTRGNFSFRVMRMVFCLVGKKTVRHDTDVYVYTIKPKPLAYKGKLTVLINGGSFSASCLVGAYLKKRPQTLFIGEESGGTAEGCNAGITPYYVLPNTKVRLRVPAFRIVHDVAPELSGHGILPDYAVTYSFKDIVSRTDLELEKAVELLNTPR